MKPRLYFFTNTGQVVSLPASHVDLFSRHASPLEVYVFVVIDGRGEDVMSDDISASMQRKTAKKEACGRSVQLPD